MKIMEMISTRLGLEYNEENSKILGEALGLAFSKGFEVGVQIPEEDFMNDDKIGEVMGIIMTAQMKWMMEEVA